MPDSIVPLMPRVYCPRFIMFHDCNEQKNGLPLLDLAASLRILLYVLRPDVLYLTVSNAAKGIAFTFGPRVAPGQHLGTGEADGPWWRSPLPPNVLVLSAGGNGHVPLPLLLPADKPMVSAGRWPPARLAPYTAILMGGMTGVTRRQVLRNLILEDGRTVRPQRKSWPKLTAELGKRNVDTLLEVGHNVSVLAYQGWHWTQVALEGRAMIMPRGYGRSSFMLYEALQVRVL